MKHTDCEYLTTISTASNRSIINNKTEIGFYNIAKEANSLSYGDKSTSVVFLLLRHLFFINFFFRKCLSRAVSYTIYCKQFLYSVVYLSHRTDGNRSRRFRKWSDFDGFSSFEYLENAKKSSKKAYNYSYAFFDMIIWMGNSGFKVCERTTTSEWQLQSMLYHRFTDLTDVVYKTPFTSKVRIIELVYVRFFSTFNINFVVRIPLHWS